jgi:2-keto-3-deoxy-L-rhamnonate aldolase RhmA
VVEADLLLHQQEMVLQEVQAVVQQPITIPGMVRVPEVEIQEIKRILGVTEAEVETVTNSTEAVAAVQEAPVQMEPTIILVMGAMEPV